MKYYLAKSEPSVYSIDDLERDGTTVWDGVTNPQAVRAIRATLNGDLAGRVAAALEHEATEQDRLRETADFREGISASLERREPRFEGR